MDKKIRGFVGKVRLWLFGRQLLHGLLWCVPAGVLVGAVMEGISCVVPWYGVHGWSMGVVGAGVLAAVIWALVKLPSYQEAAKRLDAAGLQERTLTALDLAGDESFFAKLQKQDAWTYLEQVRIRKVLPIRVTWKRPVLLLLSCVLFAAGWVLPAAPKKQAAVRHEVVQQAKEEIKKVEKAEDELKKDEDLKEQNLEEYTDVMQDIVKELKNADTKEALEKAMERAERKLEQVSEKTQNSRVKDYMQQLSKALNGNSSHKGQSGSDKNGKDQNGNNGSDKPNDSDQGDQKDPDKEKPGDGNSDQKELTPEELEKLAELEKAAEEAGEVLEKLLKELEEKGDLQELTEEELEKMKEALENLAQMQEGQELQNQLNSMAGQLGAMASGSSGALNSGVLSSGALASTLAAVNGVRMAAGNQMAIAMAGNGGNGSQGQNPNGGNNGNNSGNGSGNGNGNGSGSGNGSGNGNGSGSGGTGGGWNYGSNVGTEKDTSYNGELVAIPNQVGDDGNLTGQQSQGASYVTQGGESLTWSGNVVEYGQVIGDYSKQAMSQIGQSNYPAGVQDIVKSYFNELNK